MTASEVESKSLFHSPIGLFDFQADGVARTYWAWTESSEPVRLALWDTGIGKALSCSEPVLTTSGWSTMGALLPGDEVVSVDGTPTEVLSVHPQGERDIYRITFSDGSWTRCDVEHLWEVSFWGSDRSSGKQKRVRRTEVVSTQTLLDRKVKTPQGRRKFNIPITAPVQYPEVDLPMDPYALGVALGDGWIQDEGTVAFSTDRECLQRIGLNGGSESGGCWRTSSSRWKHHLVDLGLAGRKAHQKFVPEVYKRAHVEARRELLAGLLDTDAFPIPTGGVEFTTTSEQLADDVVELAQSLGGVARKADPRVTTYTHNDEQREGRPSWRVNVKTPEQPFRLARKAEKWVGPVKYEVARHIESIEPDGREEAVCIMVDHPRHLYLTRGHIATHNTVYSLATLAFAFEDDQIDVAVVVAEANKVYDWSMVDGPRFTDLDVMKYHGTKQRRQNILKANPQVLVMSWETGRNDIGSFMPKGRAIAEPGILTEHLKGKRVAIVFDEFSAMRNRRSKKYIAWEYLVRTLRKTEHQPMLIGLTATSVEKSPEDHFNACRILSPERSPRVEDFLARYVATYDYNGEPHSFKNITRATLVDPGVIPFNEIYAPITLRKRKTDPDVIDQFPKKMENTPTLVPMGEQQKALYDQVEGAFAGDDVSDQERQQGFTLLRLLANHPGALRFSEGEHARQIVKAVGEPFLAQMEVGKIRAMLDWQRLMGEQQTVIFTFFGQSVLPLLHTSLTEAGYRVSVNHGKMGLAERQASQDAFKAGDTQIFLSSDAGAKGLNLGCGSGLLHYEMPILPSVYTQRSDRIHRIDSVHASVTVDALMSEDTLEVPLAMNTFKRQALAESVQDVDYDDLTGDPGERFLRAHDRLALLRRSLRSS